MVNLTVSLPEELKAAMDNFPDVNWSELTRKSIQNYIKNRQDPFPPLDFELSEVHLAYSNAVMQPLLNLSLKVNNKLESQLIVDRILFTVKIVKEHYIPKGEDYHLVEAKKKAALKGVFTEGSFEYRPLSPGASLLKVNLSPSIELVKQVNYSIQNTFWMDISLNAYVQGFAHPAIHNLSIKIPIDEWKKEAGTVLADYSADWNQNATS